MSDKGDSRAGAVLPSWLSAEDVGFYDHVVDIGLSALKPLEKTGAETVNRALLERLGAEGLLPRLFPKRLGGALDADVSAVQLCLMREALARVSTEAETALALQGLGAYPIVQAGNDQLATSYVPAVAKGRSVAAFAMSEPDAGSDAGAMRLRAEPERDGWILSGTKTWISNAPEADVYAVFARTSDEGSRGITGFVVPGDAQGLSGQPIELMSPHPIGRLDFDGVFVPGDHVLGDVGEGFKVAMRTLDLFRPSVGAFAVGMAQAALDMAIDYAQSRRAFGKSLADFQAVSHNLAEMATRTQAARLLVYDAATRFGEGERTSRASAMAKLYATETAQWVIDAAIQIHGAVALQRGHPLEHLYREVRATRIYEGTSEIQREVIARDFLR
ncbi:MAG: acyl-CoA dehydrogenase family protein [Actinomycetota bacterium]|nr:acyl-CoA dehydrogenase family protein [Actinomycetota bacterium]